MPLATASSIISVEFFLNIDLIQEYRGLFASGGRLPVFLYCLLRPFLYHDMIKKSMEKEGIFLAREDFFWQVYGLTALIPKGKAVSYGQLAAMLGYPRRARMVGQAMSRAPAFLHLPCHRVVASDGRTAPHWPEQAALLKKEGIPFLGNGRVDLEKCRWQPQPEELSALLNSKKDHTGI